MISILFFSIIFGSLTQVLTFGCSQIRTKTKGLSILVKRDLKGSHSYWIYDNNGNEWEFHLMSRDGQMDLKPFGSDDNVRKYEGNVSLRFESYTEKWEIITRLQDSFYYKCGFLIESQVIECKVHWINYYIPLFGDKSFNFEKYGINLKVKSIFVKPLIMKLYPSNNAKGDKTKFVILDKEKKSQRTLLILHELKLEIVPTQNIPNIRFVDQMNDTLFSRIDSVADYNWDKGLSGWMLWFNIDGRYRYCFQPEGKDLSQQCKENLTSAFEEECYTNSRQTPTSHKSTTPEPNGKSSNVWLIIVVIAIITVVVIGVIVGLVFAYKPRNENQSNRYKTAIGSNISSDTLSQTESEIKPSAKTELSDISVLNDRPNELRIRSETQKKGFDRKDNQRSSIGTAISKPNSINTKKQNK